MKKILFVCTGNTCRSPMAEIILKAKFKAEGITTIRVGSAGLAVGEGDKINKNSLKAVRTLGYKCTSFKSKQLTSEMIKKASLIITMTREQKRYLQGFKNVCAMGEIDGLTDIIDPYGLDENFYLKTAKQIEESCEVIKNEIIKAKKGE